MSESGTGRIVLVTGGSRGIGRACVEWFLAQGDRVAATSRSGTVEGIESSDRFLSLACDMTNSDQVEAAFSTIESTWGSVEVLVANAGITRDMLVLRMSEEAFTDVIDTNLVATFRVAKRALGKMLRARSGRIIMISSVAAYLGSSGQANYAASKAGVIGMARAMAREVASRSITINVVAPGLVDTDMVAALTEDQVSGMLAQVPLGRMAAPEEIAATVGFLASEHAGYLTGAVIPVDGGLAMGH